jgi:hypothetical protein
MRDYLTVKAKQLRRARNYIRQSTGEPEELRALARDYAAHPLYPIICAMDLEVADGNRRLEAMLLEFGPEVDVPICRTDEVVDDSVKLEIMLQSAIHTRALKHYEQYVGFTKWLELNPKATEAALAKRLNQSASSVCRILSLRKNIQPIKDAAQAGLIGVAEWSEFAKYDPQQQHAMWAARMSGQFKGRDQVAKAGRKARIGNMPCVRSSRVTILMPSGTVTLSGENLAMSEIVELLGDTLKEVRKAAETIDDVKAFQSMMRARRAKKESAHA